MVARDLSMDIKRKGESSLFVRTSPGRYTLKTIAATSNFSADRSNQTQPMTALGARKPAAAAPSTTSARPRTDSDVGAAG